MARLSLLAPLLLLAACDNPCQNLCDQMAAYARECGYDVTSEDVQQCNEDNSGANLTDERARQCIEASDPQQLREWWSCDDLAENYENAAQ